MTTLYIKLATELGTVIYLLLLQSVRQGAMKAFAKFPESSGGNKYITSLESYKTSKVPLSEAMIWKQKVLLEIPGCWQCEDHVMFPWVKLQIENLVRPEERLYMLQHRFGIPGLYTVDRRTWCLQISHKLQKGLPRLLFVMSGIFLLWSDVYFLCLTPPYFELFSGSFFITST